MRHVVLTLFPLASALRLPAQSKPAKSNKAKTPSKIPLVTTSSPQAWDLLEKAMVDYENLHLDRATQGWRNAAKLDPDFAPAPAWITFASTDPVEVEAKRERAKALAPKVTSGEQLMIRWIVNVQENNFVAALPL